MVQRIPVLARHLPLVQFGCRRKQRPVVFTQMMQAGPREEIRCAGADDVMSPERIRTDRLPDVFVDLPERHVGCAVILQAGQCQATEKHIKDKRPCVTDRNRNQTQRPQKLGDGGSLLFNDLPDLVDLVRESRVCHAHPKLRTRKARRNRADFYSGKCFSEYSVVCSLDLKDFRNCLQKKTGAPLLQVRRKVGPVVGHADDIFHDTIRALGRSP